MCPSTELLPVMAHRSLKQRIGRMITQILLFLAFASFSFLATKWSADAVSLADWHPRVQDRALVVHLQLSIFFSEEPETAFDDDKSSQMQTFFSHLITGTHIK